MPASGLAMGAMAVRQPSAAAPRPSTPAASAPARAQPRLRPGHGASRGGAGAGAGDGGGITADAGAAGAFSAARTTSGVNGGCRNLTPVASKIAFAIAAVPGTDDDSPAPSGGSPGRGMSSTSMTGTSRKLRIG